MTIPLFGREKKSQTGGGGKCDFRLEPPSSLVVRRGVLSDPPSPQRTTWFVYGPQAVLSGKSQFREGISWINRVQESNHRALPPRKSVLSTSASVDIKGEIYLTLSSCMRALSRIGVFLSPKIVRNHSHSAKSTPKSSLRGWNSVIFESLQYHLFQLFLGHNHVRLKGFF